MKFRYILSVLSLLCLSCTLPLFASENTFALVDKGEVKGCIIRMRGASAVELAAAAELREYVEKITSKRLSRLRKAPAGSYPVYIALSDNKNLPLPEKAKRLLDKIQYNGFLLYADKNGLFITAKEKVALHYAVAEILKRYGKVRWITPAPDGEFVQKNSSFIVPELAEVVNPSFKYRKFNLVAAHGYTLTPKWQIRNNMTQSGILYGGAKQLGGHCFSSLIPDIYFKEKPELYALHKGKRVPQCGDEKKIFVNGGYGGQKFQPCTSNPETIRIMQTSLVKKLKENPDTNFYCILNNDSTSWCECTSCKKLDPPEEVGRGMVSTRFWLVANALIEAGKKVAPNVIFFSNPYQNFQEFPYGVKPDKRAEIIFCLHHRCYTHSIGDKKCYVNERYRNILKKWNGDGRKVQTYEYTNCLPRGKVWYLPTAPLIRKDLKYYHSIGNEGWCDEVAPYDGTFITTERVVTQRWLGGALDLYLISRMLWDINMDYDREEEEAGSLYYGKAWKAMKRFRHLLYASYSSINDHFCYGSKLWQLGRAFENRTMEKTLLSCLEEAQNAAKGDKRVEKIVARDKEFFLLTFAEGAKLFRKEHRRTAVRAGKYIKGDPSCWDLSDFAYAGNLSLKFLYGKDCLYIRYGVPPSLKNAKLEIITEKGSRSFPLTGKGGILTLPVERIRTGESMKLGVIYHCDGKKYSWNGTELKAPGIFRRITFGNDPLICNGDFADGKMENGKLFLADFGNKEKLSIVTDGTAVSGKNFLRGSGFIFQSLTGLRGPMQTYGIPRIFRGKLKVTVQYRGEGNGGLRLTTSRFKVIGEKWERLLSPGAWQKKEYIFDCKGNKDPHLLLYIFCRGGKLDMDDINIQYLD